MIVVITAGQDEHASGITGQAREEALMAELRHLTAMRLEELGHTVHANGVGKDKSGPSPTALALIEQHRPRLALALQMNSAATAGSASGTETCALPQHKRLAQTLSQAVANVLQLPVRGDEGWKPPEQARHKERPYVQAGGLVLEVAFMNNLHDLETTLKHMEQLATTIALTLHFKA